MGPSGSALKRAPAAAEHTLHACKRHFDVISAAAVARFRADPHGPIVLACGDFARMRAPR